MIRFGYGKDKDGKILVMVLSDKSEPLAMLTINPLYRMIEQIDTMASVFAWATPNSLAVLTDGGYEVLSWTAIEEAADESARSQELSDGEP